MQKDIGGFENIVRFYKKITHVKKKLDLIGDNYNPLLNTKVTLRATPRVHNTTLRSKRNLGRCSHKNFRRA